MINRFLEEYIGEDWKNLAIQSMLIGFGLSCLVYLFTVLVCSTL
jgi:hypothetical protein